jgi:hypothetical protein
MLFIDGWNIYKMPHFCYNYLTIEGSEEHIESIAEINFDFQKIHPCPFIHGENYEEGWYDWCIKYWGTNSSPRKVNVNYLPSDVNIIARFETPWNSPDTILIFLTKQYPSLTIINEWCIINVWCGGTRETRGTAGINVYSNGSMDCKYIEPRNYTNEALNLFEESNPWFKNMPDLAETMPDLAETMPDLADEESEESEEDLKSIVEVIEYTKTYEELIL